MSWQSEFGEQWRVVARAIADRLRALHSPDKPASLDQGDVDRVVKDELGAWFDGSHSTGEWLERLQRACPQVASEFATAVRDLRLEVPRMSANASFDGLLRVMELGVDSLGRKLTQVVRQADAPLAYGRLRSGLAGTGGRLASECHLLLQPQLLWDGWSPQRGLLKDAHESATIMACPQCGQPFLYCWVEVRDDSWGFAAPVTAEEAGDLAECIEYDQGIARELLNSRRRWVWPPPGYGQPNDMPHWEEARHSVLWQGGRGF